jgi:hypothetical protein
MNKNFLAKGVLIITTFLWPILLVGQNDEPCYKKTYQVADTLPRLISSVNEILQLIVKNLDVPDSLINRTGDIAIKYIINCHGESVKFKVLTIYDYDKRPIRNDYAYLSTQIIPILRNKLKWAPARQGGKDVDFLQIFSIFFDRGKISIRVTAT